MKDSCGITKDHGARPFALPAAGDAVEQVQVTTLTHDSCTEIFVCAVADENETPDRLFQGVAGALEKAGDPRIVSQEVFGISNRQGRGVELLRQAFGAVSWPVTWVEEGCDATPPVAGIHTWAVLAATVEPIRLGCQIVGTRFEDEFAQYCRVGGLLPPDISRPRDAQARAIFDQMEAALKCADMNFDQVVRTWFHNDGILSWYAEFNQVRDAFLGNMAPTSFLPASTGVGGRNAARAALTAGLLAVRPKNDNVRIAAIPSPLQCPASEYGSSFSRAVELVTPAYRRLLISGTASIGPEGDTLHVGDARAQVARTMEVVRAILESRNMTWGHVSRAVAYFKHPGDVPAFGEYCAGQAISRMPALRVACDICRDDLLFEIELDALRCD